MLTRKNTPKPTDILPSKDSTPKPRKGLSDKDNPDLMPVYRHSGRPVPLKKLETIDPALITFRPYPKDPNQNPTPVQTTATEQNQQSAATTQEQEGDEPVYLEAPATTNLRKKYSHFGKVMYPDIENLTTHYTLPKSFEYLVYSPSEKSPEQEKEESELHDLATIDPATGKPINYTPPAMQAPTTKPRKKTTRIDHNFKAIQHAPHTPSKFLPYPPFYALRNPRQCWYALFNANEKAPPQDKLTDEDLSEIITYLYTEEKHPSTTIRQARRFRKWYNFGPPNPTNTNTNNTNNISGVIYTDEDISQLNQIVQTQTADKDKPDDYAPFSNRYQRYMKYIAPNDKTVFNNETFRRLKPDPASKIHVLYRVKTDTRLGKPLEQIYPTPTTTIILKRFKRPEAGSRPAQTYYTRENLANTTTTKNTKHQFKD